MKVNTVNIPKFITVAALSKVWNRPIQWTRRYVKRKGYADKIGGRWYVTREKFLANSNTYEDAEDYTTSV